LKKKKGPDGAKERRQEKTHAEKGARLPQQICSSGKRREEPTAKGEGHPQWKEGGKKKVGGPLQKKIHPPSLRGTLRRGDVGEGEEPSRFSGERAPHRAEKEREGGFLRRQEQGMPRFRKKRSGAAKKKKVLGEREREGKAAIWKKEMEKPTFERERRGGVDPTPPKGREERWPERGKKRGNKKKMPRLRNAKELGVGRKRTANRFQHARKRDALRRLEREGQGLGLPSKRGGTEALEPPFSCRTTERQRGCCCPRPVGKKKREE